MPLAAIIVGAMLIDLGFRGTQHQFAAQLGTDFGKGSQFLTWAAAIGGFGALGYVPGVGKLADALLGLVVMVLIITKGGLFDQVQNLVLSPPGPSAAVPLSAYGNPPPDVVVEGSSGGSTASAVGSFVGSVVKAFI
jgi:hypothetical protein